VICGENKGFGFGPQISQIPQMQGAIQSRVCVILCGWHRATELCTAMSARLWTMMHHSGPTPAAEYIPA